MPSPRPRSLRLTTGWRIAAVLSCTGLTVGTMASAVPAEVSQWDRTTHALTSVPAPQVDGEVTVTEVPTGAAGGAMRSFTPSGSRVVYATQLAGSRDFQWGPAGDTVSRAQAGGTPQDTVDGSTRESLVSVQAPRPAAWSPHGESLTSVASNSAGLAPAATWTGRSTTQRFGASAPSTNPGAGAVGPWGEGMVVRQDSATDAGKPDLRLLNATFPVFANTSLSTEAAELRPLGYSALDPREPAVAADGTLAFVGTWGGVTSLYVDEGAGATAVAALGAACPGQRPAFAPSATAIAYVRASGTSCAASELRILRKVDGRFTGGTDTRVALSPSGTRFETASWRARTPAARAERMGGSDRVHTGILTSQWGHPGLSAQTVVLTSSTSFADSVVASPLAGQLEAPLLINPAAGLDSRVRAEIGRVLAPGGAVYIVGGTGAVSSTVESQLRAQGWPVVRLAGPDRFSTSVRVAEELDRLWGQTQPRRAAFLADGLNFPDALVAGPAASQYLAPVLLSNGRSMPASVRAYLDRRTSLATVFAIGGPAASAAGVLPSSRRSPIVGADRYEGAALVASRFFPGAATAGYASGRSYPDALTGGALMGALWQPLLLVDGPRVPAPVTNLARLYRPSTDVVVAFGGSAVVPDAVLAAVRNLAGTQTANFGPDVPAVTAGGSTAPAPRSAGSGASPLPGPPPAPRP